MQSSLISFPSSKKATKTLPRSALPLPRRSAGRTMEPLRDVRRTFPPCLIPSFLASSGWISQTAEPYARFSSGTLPVMVPVCHCSRTRPVQSQKGYCLSGDSAGGS